jgi:hypothetical protein
MEYVGTFYGYLAYFITTWYSIWMFGIVCGPVVYFSPFWYVWTKKHLATLSPSTKRLNKSYGE